MNPELSELLVYRDMIYELSGLWFNTSKLPLFQTKVMERVRAVKADSLREYFTRFVNNEDNRHELEQLINLLTTNETYFFRNYPQIQAFARLALPETVARKEQSGDKTLRIWSAGCSTGEEPYTLSMVLLEHLPFPELWDIRIDATDISTRVLSLANEALYNERSIHKTPPFYLEKYFEREGRKFRLQDRVKAPILFEYSNLIDAVVFEQYDFVFCRNVLIYFKGSTRDDIITKFHGAMPQGGGLFLGHTEMVFDMENLFETVYAENTFYYRKK